MTAPGALDQIEVEALLTDRYLDTLLEAAKRRVSDVPADAALDPALRGAALRLRDEVIRVHPSFRFEERLARRLASAAAEMRLAATSDETATVVPFPGPVLPDPSLAGQLANPALAALLLDRPILAGAIGAWLVARRPLLVGGALTSAALSAAYVAWRFTHGTSTDPNASNNPMARAIRAVQAARIRPETMSGGLA